MKKKIVTVTILGLFLILGVFIFFIIKWYQQLPPIADSVNFLVLGMDPRHDSLEKNETTDTILLTNLSIKNNKITTISIPRDLWVYQYHRKVNNLFPYFKYETASPNYLQDINNTLTQIIGQKIDFDVVVTTASLRQLMDIIGGVDLYLPQGFIDDQFPNPEYIASPSASTPIYKTVAFATGEIHLDSSNVTDFIRSRHASNDPATGGTDIGRIYHQQLFFDALIGKLKQVRNFSTLKKLYLFWQNQVNKNISNYQVLAILIKILPNYHQLTILKSVVPIKNATSSGVIYYPGKFTELQWAYIPTESDYQSLKTYFSQVLH